MLAKERVLPPPGHPPPANGTSRPSRDVRAPLRASSRRPPAFAEIVFAVPRAASERRSARGAQTVRLGTELSSRGHEMSLWLMNRRIARQRAGWGSRAGASDSRAWAVAGTVTAGMTKHGPLARASRTREALKEERRRPSQGKGRGVPLPRRRSGPAFKTRRKGCKVSAVVPRAQSSRAATSSRFPSGGARAHIKRSVLHARRS